jgi:hypothetical protein
MLARVLAVFCVALRTGTGLALAVGAPSLRLLERLSVESRVPQAAAPPARDRLYLSLRQILV